MLKKIMNWIKNSEIRNELVDANPSRCFDLNDLSAEELNALLA